MFNVTAAHHTPGGRPRPFDDPRAQSGARVGDPLPGFPNWSHTWYGGHLSADGHAYTMVPPGSGQSGWESETISHHRPGYPGLRAPTVRTRMDVQQRTIKSRRNAFACSRRSSDLK